MEFSFTKMTGAGNDFVVADNRDGKIRDGSVLARRVCDRHFGIGADGLLLVEESASADFRMMYYNADGSYGGMCGNGGRCIALFAYKNGIAGSKQSFKALDSIYRAVVGSDSVELSMKDPSRIRTGIMLRTSAGTFECSFVDTGAPHVVIPLKDDAPGRPGLSSIDVVKVGSEIRHHKEFAPDGTNVNFIKVEGPSRLRIRTYERGVEQETLACGTGSVAAAVIAAELRLSKPPLDVQVKSNIVLRVDFARNAEKSFTAVRLSGPAITVFAGKMEID